MVYNVHIHVYILCIFIVDYSLSLLPGSHEVVDTVAYKLQQHRFPPQKWNVLATCLRMASVVQEIDADERHVRDKLQALVVTSVLPSLFERRDARLNHFVWTSGYALQRVARAYVNCELGFSVKIVNN